MTSPDHHSSAPSGSAKAGITNMKPEEQRIAIAEVCGWSDIRNEEIEDVDYDLRSVTTWTVLAGTNPQGSRRAVPRYLEDLNAMAEAEKVLIDMGATKRTNYIVFLSRLVEWSPDSNPLPLVHATASQRAEAFLKAVGKYKSETK